MTGKILSFAGSSRRGSLTRKLLDVAIGACRARGADITDIDLRGYDLPIYDGDLELAHGIPASALRLRAEFRRHDALLIGVTEYNGGVTPLLKNALDWASRPHGDEPNLSLIRGKVAAMVSCSAGAMGGSRAQAHLRQSFQVMGCLLVPETVTLPFAETAFEGAVLKDPLAGRFVDMVADGLVTLLGRLSAGRGDTI